MILHDAVDAQHDFGAGYTMASINDEKLVLHARERLVVHDFLKDALLRLAGQSVLDCGCPSFERRGMEGIWEEVVGIRRHRCINCRGKVLTVCEQSARAVPSP